MMATHEGRANSRHPRFSAFSAGKLMLKNARDMTRAVN
jgi:hypothetical protein